MVKIIAGFLYGVGFMLGCLITRYLLDILLNIILPYYTV